MTPPRIPGARCNDTEADRIMTAIRGFFLLLLLTVCLRAAPPNFVIILTDDQGYGDLGCYGAPYIRTPNIDRMAREGVRFTDFYAQPFCGPSRAALMTGTYPARNSLMFNHLPRAETGIHPDELTLAELLRSRGYATGIIGKWHLGDAPEFLPLRHGFDFYFGLPYSNDMWPYHPKVLRTPDDPPLKTAIRERAEYTGFQGQGQTYPLDWFPDLPLIRGESVIDRNPDQAELTARYHDEALAFIERHRDRPFFLYLAHSMPHVPLFRSKEFEGVSPRGLYGDVIEEIDAGAGRILRRLEELGLDERTFVVFFSDNGPWADYGIDAGSAGPLRGAKGSVWEGGVRTPAIMRWPGRISAGQVTSSIAASIDIYPTFARLAGAELPADRTIDGVDLWPLLTAGEPPRDAFYYYAGQVFYKAAEGAPVNAPELAAVRHGRWKLHLAGQPKLYDLHADVGETKDVSGHHPGVVDRLRSVARDFDRRLQADIRPLGRR